MPIPSDQAPPSHDYLIREIAELKRQVRELQAARRLEAATIGQGGLTINGGTVRITGDGRLTSEYDDGAVALDLGQFFLGGNPVHGVVIRRPGGELAFWTYGNDSGGSAYWSLFDLAGNIIMSDDANSGQGLATPYIPLTTTLGSQITTAAVTVTSATFARTHTVHGPKQHPKLRVKVLCQSDAGITGEVRMVDTATNTQIGSVTSIPGGDNTYRFLEGTIGGGHLQDVVVDVEARRISASGGLRVGVMYAEGKQS